MWHGSSLSNSKSDVLTAAESAADEIKHTHIDLLS